LRKIQIELVLVEIILSQRPLVKF